MSRRYIYGHEEFETLEVDTGPGWFPACGHSAENLPVAGPVFMVDSSAKYFYPSQERLQVSAQ